MLRQGVRGHVEAETEAAGDAQNIGDPQVDEVAQLRQRRRRHPRQRHLAKLRLLRQEPRRRRHARRAHRLLLQPGVRGGLQTLACRLDQVRKRERERERERETETINILTKHFTRSQTLSEEKFRLKLKRGRGF